MTISGKERQAVTENLFQSQYVFLRSSSRASRDSTYSVQVNCIFLSERR